MMRVQCLTLWTGLETKVYHEIGLQPSETRHSCTVYATGHFLQLLLLLLQLKLPVTVDRS